MSLRLVAVALVSAGAAAGAVQTPLTPRLVDEAVVLGKSAVERTHASFHAPYRLAVARPPVDFIEVITPLRRVVLLTEQRVRSGERGFGSRQAMEDADVRAAELELRAELTFHPLNTYVGVPAYDMSLVAAGSPRIEPRTFNRTPRYGPRFEGPPMVTAVPGGGTLPGASQPILGGTVSARFDLDLVNGNGIYEVLIAEKETELVRVRLDLSRLR